MVEEYFKFIREIESKEIQTHPLLISPNRPTSLDPERNLTDEIKNKFNENDIIKYQLKFSISKKIIHFNKITKLGKWKNNSHGLDLFELKNKKIGIFGLGKIGLYFAKLCKSFDMNVYYHDLVRKKKYEKK